MAKNILFMLTMLIGMISCTDSSMNKVVGDQLTVHFENAKDEKVAEKLARFWLENELVTGQPQDIKLSSDSNSYSVGIIAVEPQSVKQLPFTEQKLLTDLRRQLRTEVFDGEMVVLNLCNAKFETLYQVN